LHGQHIAVPGGQLGQHPVERISLQTLGARLLLILEFLQCGGGLLGTRTLRSVAQCLFQLGEFAGIDLAGAAVGLRRRQLDDRGGGPQASSDAVQ